MGLPPAQGHNNLRLYSTTNSLPKYRLDTTHNNHTRKPTQLFRSNQMHPSIPSFANRIHAFSLSPPTPTIHRQWSTKRNNKKRSHKLSRASSNTYQRPSTFSLERNPSRKINRFSATSKSSVENTASSLSNFSPSDVNAPKIVSNLPLINSSVLVVNNSPFGLRDPQVGILHHCSQSISYFWEKTKNYSSFVDMRSPSLFAF